MGLPDQDIQREGKKMNGFHIFLNGKWLDTVFFTSNSEEEVRRSLIDHDGYSPAIKVVAC